MERAPGHLETLCPKMGLLFPFQLLAAATPGRCSMDHVYQLLQKGSSFTSMLDDSDYREICQSEMELAQFEQRQDLSHDKLNEK